MFSIGERNWRRSTVLIITIFLLLFQLSIKKQVIAKNVMQSFDSSKLVVVYHYNDVNCQEWNKIRNKLAKYDMKLNVIPTKLSSKVNLTDIFCSEGYWLKS